MFLFSLLVCLLRIVRSTWGYTTQQTYILVRTYDQHRPYAREYIWTQQLNCSILAQDSLLTLILLFCSLVGWFGRLVAYAARTYIRTQPHTIDVVFV